MTSDLSLPKWRARQLVRRMAKRGKPKPKMKSPYVSLADAALILGVHVNTIYNWTNSGAIEGVVLTPGGQRKIPRTSINALLSRLSKS